MEGNPVFIRVDGHLAELQWSPNQGHIFRSKSRMPLDSEARNATPFESAQSHSPTFFFLPGYGSMAYWIGLDEKRVRVCICGQHPLPKPFASLIPPDSALSPTPPRY